MKITGITEQEKRNLIIKSLDKNMFVEAGAGAGKTTIIVSRIIRQLMSGVKPGQIVAITFTNAATRELRGRILNVAQKVVADPVNQPASLKGNSTEIDNLKQALLTLDQMQISTIHSFCYRILSERMFDAGLPVGFGLVEENVASSDKDRLFKLWAESLKREDWEKLLPVGKYRSGVADRINSLARQLDGIPADMNICVAVPDKDEKEASDYLKVITDSVFSEIKDTVNEAYGLKYPDFMQIDDDYLTTYGKSLKTVFSQDDLREKYKKLLALPTTKSFAVKAPTKADMDSMGIDKKNQPDHKARIADKDNNTREFLESKADEIKEYKAGYENTFYRPFIGYAKEVCKYWNDKLPEGYLTNDTLLSKTAELVKNSKDALTFLGNKFRYIYVDEFQDTDHTQENFIRMLASDPDKANSLKDGALFVVGDPKQSIYRFRGAEPEVYFEAKERMEKADNALVVELSDNYRSNDMVITWINKAFATKNITQGYPYAPMNVTKSLPQAGLPEKLIAGVYKYESPETALKKDDIYIDAQNVCRLILTLVGNAHKIADYDRNGKLYFRDIKFSDFLILSMNTPGMDEYKSAFNEYGIPVAMDSKTDISSEKELSAFVRLYAFIANPYDRTAREGALEALWKLGLADVKKNEEILEALILDTKDMSAYGAVEYLAKRPELYLSKDKDIEGHRIYDIQKKIVQMTEAIKSGAYGNKGTVLDALREYCGGIVEHELIMEKDIDAVRFMNLHKAKGLEGGIVIWANRIENKTFHEDSYRTGRDFYPSLKYSGFSGTEWCAVSGDKKLMDNARLQDECENIRLEYVAATRAKQALIFMDRYNAKEGNMFTNGYNLDSLPSIAEVVKKFDDNSDDASETTTLDITGADQKKDSTKQTKLSSPVFSSESPSDYENDSAGRVTVNRNNGENDDTKTDVASTSERRAMEEGVIPRPTGAVFGTVMHRAFELVIDRWNCSCEELGIEKDRFVPACIDQAVNESADDIPEGDVEKIKTFLYEAVMAFGRWFVQSDIKKRAEHIYTELPFSYIKETDDENNPDIWMHGEADFVARLDDGSYHILDYKSDNDALYPDEDSFTERLWGKYSPQIDAYTEAVSRVFKTGPDKIRASLVSFSQKDLKDGEKLRVRVTDIR